MIECGRKRDAANVKRRLNMKCTKCGAENNESNRYCRVCGQPLIVDIMSDSRGEPTKKYKKRKAEPTKKFTPDRGEGYKRRHTIPEEFERHDPKTEPENYDYEQPQPKTSIPRGYNSPERVINTYSGENVYDYNDNFDNNKYEKTDRVERQNYNYINNERRRKSAANVPYLIVTYLTAVISLLNFALPFLEWVRFTLNINIVGINYDEKLSVFQIVNNLFRVNDANELFGDTINDILSWDIVPDFLRNSVNSLNATFAFAKLAALIIFSFMALSLLLYVVFFVLAVFRRRSATGVGITAAIIMILSSGAYIFVMQYISAQTEGVFTIETAPYLAITLSVVMLILISVMSVLRAVARR